MPSRIITWAKYPGTCAVCKQPIEKDAVIKVDLASNAKWHKKCDGKKEGKHE